MASAVKVHVEERFWTHAPEEWEAWVSGKREGYPRDRRLKFWRGDRPTKQTKYGFGETYVATSLMRRGYMCWTWFTLFGETTHSTSRRASGSELARLLRESGRALDPSRIPSLVAGGVKLRPPDVVAYHPRSEEWRFIEVKRPNDRVKPGQLLALAALAHFLEASAEIARLVPETGHGVERQLEVQLQLNASGLSAAT